MGKRIKDKDPECKNPIGKDELRCGGCGSAMLRELVRYADVFGYDEGVRVGVCLACQALFKNSEEIDAAPEIKLTSPEPEPEVITHVVEAVEEPILVSQYEA